MSFLSNKVTMQPYFYAVLTARMFLGILMMHCDERLNVVVHHIHKLAEHLHLFVSGEVDLRIMKFIIKNIQEKKTTEKKQHSYTIIISYILLW